MSRILTLDPTEREEIRYEFREEESTRSGSWRVAKKSGRGVGAELIAQLKNLKLSHEDELRVIVGPGNFTGIRVATLIGNALHFLNGVKLSARTTLEKKWRRVKLLQPFYAEPPKIGYRFQGTGNQRQITSSRSFSSFIIHNS